MTKIKQVVQGNMDTSIYKCYCGEYSYLEIIRDEEDSQFYFHISVYPTRLLERLVLAWKALRGIEFMVSNEVIVDGKDVPDMIKFLKGKNNA